MTDNQVVDTSRIGSKNMDVVEKYHKLCCRKAEIKKQIECSTCPDQKTSLTLELARVTEKIKSFWSPRTQYKNQIYG